MKLNTIALAVLLAPMAAVSQAEVTFTPFATYQWFDSSSLENIYGAPNPDLEDKEGFGLSLGYRFTPAIGLEAHFARTETQDDFTGATTDFRSDRLSLDGYYTFNADGKFSPYVLIGAGQGRLKPDGLDSNVDTIVNAGLGAFYRFNDKVALRAEAREVFNSDEDLNDAVAMLGLEFSPGTAAAVADEPEPQPEPEQAPVEEQAAAPVEQAPVDTDGDGVTDDADKCPATPAGVQVDANGCPLNDDGDDVANYLDKCPSTAEGVVVDDNGCEKTLTEAINLELKVQFDSGKAVVKDEYKAEISKAAELMKQYPSAHMEIQGHTDSSGRAAANTALSQQRADAVRAVLVNEMGVKGDNITAKGYGSAQPVADNKTAEGRTQNRRVIAVVSGEAKKVIRKAKKK